MAKLNATEWNEIISGIIGQLLCIYFLTRFTVDYVRHIQQISHLTKVHIQGVCIWICGLTFFTMQAFFFKNLLHLDVSSHECTIYDTIRNSMRRWQKGFLYLQFTSATSSISEISNLSLVVSSKFIIGFRACIVLGLLLLQFSEYRIQTVVEEHRVETNSWAMCYMTDAHFEQTNFKIHQIVSAFVQTIFSIRCALICVKQATMVSTTCFQVLSYFEVLAHTHTHTDRYTNDNRYQMQLQEHQ